MPDDEKAPTMSDGARCRVCGHFEISFDRAEERYAHCPSCGRAPHWLRVPTEKSYEAHTWLKIHHWKLDGTYLELQPELGTGYWFVVDWRHPEVSIGGSLPLPQAKAAALRYARNNPRKSLVGWAPTGEEVMETKPGEAEALQLSQFSVTLRVPNDALDGWERFTRPAKLEDLAALLAALTPVQRAKALGVEPWPGSSDEEDADADRVLAMSNEELDAEIRSMGGDPARVHKWSKAMGRWIRMAADFSGRWKAAEAERDQLRADLESRRSPEATLDLLRSLRGFDTPCERCHGAGCYSYSSTATWRGGMGGQAFTTDVCDACWGTGDAHQRGVDLRAKKAELTELRASLASVTKERDELRGLLGAAQVYIDGLERR